jgi:RHS repeat-associated protein
MRGVPMRTHLIRMAVGAVVLGSFLLATQAEAANYDQSSYCGGLTWRDCTPDGAPGACGKQLCNIPISFEPFWSFPDCSPEYTCGCLLTRSEAPHDTILRYSDAGGCFDSYIQYYSTQYNAWNECRGTFSSWQCRPTDSQSCTLSGSRPGVRTCEATGPCTSAWGTCQVPKCRPEEDPECCLQYSGDPVDLGTGTVGYTPLQLDVVVDAPSGRLSVDRRYSSWRAALDLADQDMARTYAPKRSFGAGWYHQFQYLLVEHIGDPQTGVGQISVQFPDGTWETFDTAYGPTSHGGYSLIRNQNSPQYSLRLHDGTVVEFEEVEVTTANPVVARDYRPVVIREPSGRELHLRYYHYEPVTYIKSDPCQLREAVLPNQVADANSGRLCLVVSDDAFLRFTYGIFKDVYTNYSLIEAGTGPFIREIRAGAIPLDGNFMVASVNATQRAVYCYSKLQRLVTPTPASFRASWLAEAIHQQRESTDDIFPDYDFSDTACIQNTLSTPDENVQFVKWWEDYNFTRCSYNRPDLVSVGRSYAPDPAPYNCIASKLILSTRSSDDPSSSKLILPLLARSTFSRIVDPVLPPVTEFVSGFEYDTQGRAVADFWPGGYQRITYTSSTETIVTHESQGGNTVAYTIADGRVTGASDKTGCAGKPASIVRNESTGVVRTTALPVPPAAGVVTTALRDARGRVTLELVNPSGGNDGTTVPSAAEAGLTPTRIKMSGYDGHKGRATSLTTPTKESKKYSVLCPAASAFGVTGCGSAEPMLLRDFDVHADDGGTHFNDSPGSLVTKEFGVGYTLDADTKTAVLQTRKRKLEYRAGSADLAKTTDPRNIETTYTYYGSGAQTGRLHEITVGSQVIEQRTSYDSSGRVLEAFDRTGMKTTYTYDDLGRITSRLLSKSDTTETRLTTFTYAGNGRLVQTKVGGIAYPVVTNAVYFDGASGTLPPPSSPQFCSTTSLWGGGSAASSSDVSVAHAKCLTALGSAGRVVARTSGTLSGETFTANQTDSYTYTTTGLPELVTKRNGNGDIRRLSKSEYDDKGSLIRRFKYTTSLADTSPDYVKDLYPDILGRVTASTDERFATGTDHAANAPLVNRELEYDALGRVSKVRVKVGSGQWADTQYGYDLHDNLKKVIDPDGRVTEYLYDDFGQLVLVKSPDSGTTLYEYDEAGRLVTRTTADGTLDRAVITLAYDDENRLTSETFVPTTGATITRNYHYDGPYNPSGNCSSDPVELLFLNTEGRLAWVSDDAGATYYSYSPFGEIVATYEQEAGSFDACALRITRYIYDSAGRLTEVTYPSGRQVSYVYASNDLRPSSIEVVEGGQSTTLLEEILYDVDGAVIGYTAGSHVKATMDFDLAGQLTDRSYADGASALFSWGISDRDGSGNIKVVGDTVTGKSLAVTYDAGDRVSSVTGTKVKGYNDCQDITYDLAGNRESEACFGKTLTYGHDSGSMASNQLSSIGWNCGSGDPVTTYGINYDDGGNALNGYTKRFPLAADDYTLFYDAARRVVEAEVGIGAQSYFYTYDHRNLRTLKYGPGGYFVIYTYDTNGRLLSENDSFAGVREYIWLGGEPVAMLARYPGQEATSSRRYILASNHLGVPLRAYEHGSGRAVWAMDQEVFGRGYEYNPQASSQPLEISIPIRYPGQYFDEETGLHYNGARYYSPDLGSFISPDPILVGVNVPPAVRREAPSVVYTYGANNPLKNTDPQGLWQTGDDIRNCPAYDAALSLARYQAGCNDSGKGNECNPCQKALKACGKCDICSILQPGQGPTLTTGSWWPCLNPGSAACTVQPADWTHLVTEQSCSDPGLLAEVLLHEAVHQCSFVPFNEGGACGANSLGSLCRFER